MFKNYLKIALRNLIRQRGYSLLNIVGLAIGMTCCMLILIWVQDELSYDRFNENAEDIYRVVENQYYTHGGVFPVAVTPSALAPALKAQFPEIVKSTRVTFRDWTVGSGEKILYQDLALVDPDFLDIFTLNFLKGDPQTALATPRSLIITQEMAEKYFGETDPLGNTLKINNRDDFQVSAVIEKIPHNVHFRYDCLLPFTYLGEFGRDLNRWDPNAYYTYVLLQKNTPYKEVDKKIIDFIMRNKENSDTEIYLQPLTEIHLRSAGKYTADIGGHGDIQYVRIFSIIAFFVLLIACINFMNLATARSEKRAREVGLRKVIGARRSQLIRQFLGEAVLLSLIAFCVAWLCTELLLPVFNDLSGKTLTLSQLGNPVLLAFVGVALFAGLVSGSYPALYLSSFQPIATLKSGKHSHTGGSWFRKILVILQFTLSVIMIIGTLVVSKQMDFIRNKKLGLNKDNLAYIWLSGEFRRERETAKQELLRNPGITDITFTSQLPTYVASSTSGWDWEGKNPEEEVLMHYLSVDCDYAGTFKMEMAAGRFFSREFATDTLAVVINETAAEIMDIDSPVDKRLSLGNTDLTIIGVVKDFHFKPIHTQIEPMVLINNERWHNYNVMVLRHRPENISQTVAYIESIYKKFNHNTPFSLNFLDQRYDALYRAEQRIGRLSSYFAAIAIFIACLGLYGLASYVAEQRTKEIGIRKVLGASVAALFTMMSRSFVLLVAVANLIAWPVGYFIATDWLQNFAYRIEIGWWEFLLAGALALLIALLTVSYQAIKAALANPVESLRYE